MALGSFFQAAGYYQMGRAAKAKGRAIHAEKAFEAAQARQQSGQALAAGQYNMLEQQRQTRLVQSRIQALVAAGGGGTMDATTVNLIGNQAGEGAYRAALALYQGEDKARSLRIQADTADYEGALAEMSGEMEQNALNLQAAGALVDGITSVASKAGGSGGGGN